MLGLPDEVTACLFDLDGVLTQTAAVHRAAWKETFDDFLRGRAERNRRAVPAVRPGPDYNEYVDGRPRADGVRTFLSSRGISAAIGRPGRPAGRRDTVHGIGNRKNEIVRGG